MFIFCWFNPNRDFGRNAAKRHIIQERSCLDSLSLADMKVPWNQRNRILKTIEAQVTKTSVAGQAECIARACSSPSRTPTEAIDVHFCTSSSCSVCRLSKTLSFLKTDHVSPRTIQCMPVRWWDKDQNGAPISLFDQIMPTDNDDDSIPYDEKRDYDKTSFVQSIVMCLQPTF